MEIRSKAFPASLSCFITFFTTLKLYINTNLEAKELLTRWEGKTPVKMQNSEERKPTLNAERFKTVLLKSQFAVGSFELYQYFLPKNQSCKLQKLESRLERPWILFPYKSLKSEIALTLKLLLLTLKLEEVANYGMFFHVL